MDSPSDSADSLLEKLDASVPTTLKEFDAFPKLPSTYKSRSEGRGYITAFIALVCFVLVINDLGEWIWGWSDYEFSVDHNMNNQLGVNVDLVVNMPCQYLSVDLRDAVGDRLYLSSGFHRDGTLFDIGQATTLKEHAAELTARQVVRQSRKTRGLFSFFRPKQSYKPTYNYQADGSACRVYGTLAIKKVTANLHITTLGHGYSSYEHVPHNLMNLSHVITEFSFGPYFPDITQPLDNSFEITHDPFIAYQYFLHIVPTTYVAPRQAAVSTNQYSVTHYTKTFEHGRGTPGIFLKFDFDPMAITVYQRTTSFIEFIIRCFGVVGGIFTCMGYAIKVGARAVEAVTGPDTSDALVPEAASSGISKSKWRGGQLSARPGGPGRVVRQGSGWVVEGGSPYSGSVVGTPMSAASAYAGSPAYAGTPFSPFAAASPAPGSAFGPPPRSAAGTPLVPGTPALGTAPPSSTGLGLGLSPGAFGPHSSPQNGYGVPSAPPTPAAGYSHFPPTPSPGAGFGVPPSPNPGAYVRPPISPSPSAMRKASSNGSMNMSKKDD